VFGFPLLPFGVAILIACFSAVDERFVGLCSPRQRRGSIGLATSSPPARPSFLPVGARMRVGKSRCRRRPSSDSRGWGRRLLPLPSACPCSSRAFSSTAPRPHHGAPDSRRPRSHRQLFFCAVERLSRNARGETPSGPPAVSLLLGPGISATDPAPASPAGAFPPWPGPPRASSHRPGSPCPVR
jgi:hypothetical protein